MDTYNLGWKLAYVTKNLASRDILSTYETERIKIARELINFDHKLSRMFSGKPLIPNNNSLTKPEGVDMNEFHEAFYKGNEFASGTVVDYASSQLVCKPEANNEVDLNCIYTKPYATNIPIGRRFDSAKVVQHSDARPIIIADHMLSDGRWRILNFCGNYSNLANKETLKMISDFVYSDNSFRVKYTPVNSHEDSVIDILSIYSSDRESHELFDFPRICVPRDFKKRLNYWKLYAGIEDTLHEGRCDAYKKYGIDSEKGAIVVVRPDGYIAMVNEFNLDSYKNIAQFFEKFMVSQSKNILPTPTQDDLDRFIKPLLAV
ncbi:uncharacterized protein AC631_05942 [Debaryomyces fabryi]|uniref:FAD-binding domain-containing protein n=1 Tax=Debaryomyces fabryi TaxID=58627 RepID=A0A0V1PQ55_9ASCO|nr:uncharacterized protein AC631_05942 [Debaryomyces fabryi]KRZ98298.1 hypothetical protein AC631_05942 [Debaryomyces fabryi]